MLNRNIYQRGTDLFVAGEIYNQMESTLWIASVQIMFHSDQGSVIVDAATEVTVLAPGRKIAFHVGVGELSYENYDFDLLHLSLPSEVSRADLSAVGNGFKLVDGAYRIRGRVQNLGAELDDYALVVATLFDGQGRVAGVSSVEIDADDLSAGVLQDFEISIDQYAPDVATYEVQAFGF